MELKIRVTREESNGDLHTLNEDRIDKEREEESIECVGRSMETVDKYSKVERKKLV